MIKRFDSSSNVIFSKFEQLQKQKSLKYLIDEGIEIDFNWLHL